MTVSVAKDEGALATDKKWTRILTLDGLYYDAQTVYRGHPVFRNTPRSNVGYHYGFVDHTNGVCYKGGVDTHVYLGPIEPSGGLPLVEFEDGQIVKLFVLRSSTPPENCVTPIGAVGPACTFVSYARNPDNTAFLHEWYGLDANHHGESGYKDAGAFVYSAAGRHFTSTGQNGGVVTVRLEQLDDLNTQ